MIKRYHAVGVSVIVPILIIAVLFGTSFLTIYYKGHYVDYAKHVVHHGVRSTEVQHKLITHDWNYARQTAFEITLVVSVLLASILPSNYCNNKYVYKEYVSLIKHLLNSDDMEDIIEAEQLIYLGQPEYLVKDLPVFEFSPYFTTRQYAEHPIANEHRKMYAYHRKMYAYIYYKTLIAYYNSDEFNLSKQATGFKKENSQTIFTKIKSIFNAETKFKDANISADDIDTERNFTNEKAKKSASKNKA